MSKCERDQVSGEEMHALITELFPICRSITGNGARATLQRIKARLPLIIHAVPTGTRVLDWTVPKEWNIRDAFIKNARGERIVDFRESNLHVVSYSVPFRGRLHMSELRPHLFTLPEYPDWIPYRTSYYKESWGFCLSERQLSSMEDEYYDVCIDSSLEDGELVYGEYEIPGQTTNEVLISCHICHPSLANDNLSSIAVAVCLAADIAARPRRYSYRFLFGPGTIGAITWLARNAARVERIRHGLVMACVGDEGAFTYKKSRRGSAEIDRVVPAVLKDSGRRYRVEEFTPYGYDERQFCSPGFDMPVGSFTRTPHGRFPEYHTSADNLEFVKPSSLGESLDILRRVVAALEDNRRYVNVFPKGEPQLGRRGLYPATGGGATEGEQNALLWVLSFSDGHHTLLDIAERAGLSFSHISTAAARLMEHGLLREAGAHS